MPTPNENLVRLHQNLSSKWEGFNVPLSQFEQDMQDEAKAKRLHENLTKNWQGFNVPFDQFRTDLGYGVTPSNVQDTTPTPAPTGVAEVSADELRQTPAQQPNPDIKEEEKPLTGFWESAWNSTKQMTAGVLKTIEKAAPYMPNGGMLAAEQAEYNLARIKGLDTSQTMLGRKMADIGQKSADLEATVKPTEGLVATLGGLFPQMVGIVASVASAPFTAGTSLSAAPAIIGGANLSFLISSSVGNSMSEYEKYMQDKGKQANEAAMWGVGLTAGALEYVTEKIALNRYLPKGTIAKTVAKTFNDAGEGYAAQIFNEFAKQKGVQQLIKRFSYNTIKNALQEGGEELLTEIGNIITEFVYKDFADAPGLEEIGTRMWKSFEGGALMGGILGPVSSWSKSATARKVREQNGYVTVATDKEGNSFEVLGEDGNGNSVVIAPNGEEKIIKNDDLENISRFGLKDFEKFVNIARSGKEISRQQAAESELTQEYQRINQTVQGLLYRGEETFPSVVEGQQNDDPDVVITAMTTDGETYQVIGGSVNRADAANPMIAVNTKTGEKRMLSNADISRVDIVTAAQMEAELKMEANSRIKQKYAIEQVAEQVKEQFQPGDIVQFNGMDAEIVDVTDPSRGITIKVTDAKGNEQAFMLTPEEYSKIQSPQSAQPEQGAQTATAKRKMVIGKKEFTYEEKPDNTYFVPFQDGKDETKVIAAEVDDTQFDVVPVTEEVPVENAAPFAKTRTKTVVRGVNIVPKQKPSANAAAELQPATPEGNNSAQSVEENKQPEEAQGVAEPVRPGVTGVEPGVTEGAVAVLGDIEAKKADIERRRLSELASVGRNQYGEVMSTDGKRSFSYTGFADASNKIDAKYAAELAALERGANLQPEAANPPVNEANPSLEAVNPQPEQAQQPVNEQQEENEGLSEEVNPQESEQAETPAITNTPASPTPASPVVNEQVAGVNGVQYQPLKMRGKEWNFTGNVNDKNGDLEFADPDGNTMWVAKGVAKVKAKSEIDTALDEFLNAYKKETGEDVRLRVQDDIDNAINQFSKARTNKERKAAIEAIAKIFSDNGLAIPISVHEDAESVIAAYAKLPTTSPLNAQRVADGFRNNNANAFYDQKSGTIFICASNTTSFKDAVETIVHESCHNGTQKSGKQSLISLFDKVGLKIISKFVPTWYISRFSGDASGKAELSDELVSYITEKLSADKEFLSAFITGQDLTSFVGDYLSQFKDIPLDVISEISSAINETLTNIDTNGKRQQSPNGKFPLFRSSDARRQNGGRSNDNGNGKIPAAPIDRGTVKNGREVEQADGGSQSSRDVRFSVEDDQAETLSAGIKLINAYIKSGVYKFSDIVNSLVSKGVKISDGLLASLKKAYASIIVSQDIDGIDDINTVKNYKVDTQQPTSNERLPDENSLDRTSEAKQVQDVAGQDSGQRPAAKEAWEMTREEFTQTWLRISTSMTPWRSGGAQKKALSEAPGIHKGHIIQALSEGKPVPAEVLADYPELQPKQEPKTTFYIKDDEHRDSETGKITKYSIWTKTITSDGKEYNNLYSRQETKSDAESFLNWLKNGRVGDKPINEFHGKTMSGISEASFNLMAKKGELDPKYEWTYVPYSRPGVENKGYAKGVLKELQPKQPTTAGEKMKQILEKSDAELKAYAEAKLAEAEARRKKELAKQRREDIAKRTELRKNLNLLSGETSTEAAQKALDAGDITMQDLEQMPKSEFIARFSTQPLELLTQLGQTSRYMPEDMLDPKEAAIADNIGKVKPESVYSNGDRNKVSQSMAKAYFARKDEAGESLDDIALQASGVFLDETSVTPQDVWEFMEKFPNGAQSFYKQKNPDYYTLEDKFENITGVKPTEILFERARTLIAEQKARAEEAARYIPTNEELFGLSAEELTEIEDYVNNLTASELDNEAENNVPLQNEEDQDQPAETGTPRQDGEDGQPDNSGRVPETLREPAEESVPEGEPGRKQQIANLESQITRTKARLSLANREYSRLKKAYDKTKPNKQAGINDKFITGSDVIDFGDGAELAKQVQDAERRVKVLAAELKTLEDNLAALNVVTDNQMDLFGDGDATPNPPVNDQPQPTTYKYRLLYRPANEGFPVNGFTGYENDGTKYGLLIYNRELTPEEIKSYELEPVVDVNEYVGKDVVYYEEGDQKFYATVSRVGYRNKEWIQLDKKDENGNALEQEQMLPYEFLNKIKSGELYIDDAKPKESTQEVNEPAIDPSIRPEKNDKLRFELGGRTITLPFNEFIQRPNGRLEYDFFGQKFLNPGEYEIIRNGEVINKPTIPQPQPTTAGNITSASSRFKPKEKIVFDPALVGKNGNKLVAYEWKYDWSGVKEDKRDGGLKEYRVSDWSQAETSAETGRDIVHQFFVERTDGVTVVVSSESVLDLLGYTDKNQPKKIPSLVSAAKTLAKQRMKLAILKAQQAEYDEVVKKVSEMPLPEIEIAGKDDLKFVWKNGYEDWIERGYTFFKMGDVSEQQSKDESNSKTPTERVKESLKYEWQTKRIEEYGVKKPYGIYDLERAIERQEKKIKEITESIEPTTAGDKLKQMLDKENTVQPETINAPVEKIEDFGEKIEGAKKDTWKVINPAVSDIESQPLSKTFPRPDFVKLVADGTLTEDGAMIMMFLYDSIPTKPQKSYKVGRWAKQVQDAINTMNDFVENPGNAQKFIDNLSAIERGRYSSLAKDFFWYRDVKKALGFPAEDVRTGQYEIKKFDRIPGESEPNGKTTYSIVKDRYIINDFDTLEDAANGIKNLLAANKEKSGDVKLSIYQDTRSKTFFIGRKAATGTVRLIDNIETLAEARTIFKEQMPQLQEMWQNLKVKPEERRKSNRPRVGVDYRKDKDVSPEEFANTFGFRGVQFGNWVNNAERQQALNEAYDGLMDLATALKITPKAISLGGELGLAFGARGSGKFSAHYESGEVVINLTKTKGAGSLAHEWWHALDSYFSRKRGKKLNFLTQSPIQGYRTNENRQVVPDDRIRKEMADAFGEVVDAINNSKLPKRSAELDKTRSEIYWSDIIEMSARSFENYIIEKLGANGESNDYLANFKEIGEWIQSGAFTEDSFPYPLKDESPVINDAFDKLFETIETQTDEAGNEVLFRAQSFYSPTERALQQIKQERGSVAQFKAMLLKNGAKQAEMDWMGWDERFPDAGKMISKADIQQWIDQNKIEVQEVTKGASMWDGDMLVENGEMLADVYQDSKGRWHYRSDYVEESPAFKTREEAMDNAEADVLGINSENDTKYSQYKTPGGENYKEVLLVMPKDKGLLWKQNKAGLWAYFVGDKQVSDGVPDNTYKEIARKTINSRNILESQKDDFKSSHFDEPNIVVHARIQEFADADGKRVLMVEEIQSDISERIRQLEIAVKNGKATAADIKELERLKNITPFKQTPQWVKLALRRVMQYAAENGFDRVAWTTGEMQVERYDLSKQVDKLAYQKREGGYFVSAMINGVGNPLNNGNLISENQLEEYVGKEVAQKIVNGEGDVQNYAGNNEPRNEFKELSGTDLKVGGEGMKAFYDLIIPSAVADISKKFGGKVESVEIPFRQELDYENPQEDLDDIMQVKSIALTPQMKEAFAQPQPLFRKQDPDYEAQILREFTQRADRIQQFASRARELGKTFGVPIRIITNRNQLPPRISARMAAGRIYSGVYDMRTGQIYVLVNEMQDIADVEKTIAHEIVAHKGLRDMLGAEKFDRVLDMVYANMNSADIILIKQVYGSQNYTPDNNEVADEYMASLAETGNFPSWFGRVISRVRNLLRNAGFNVQFTDADIMYLLWQSRRRLMKQAGLASYVDYVAKEQDIMENVRFSVSAFHGSPHSFDRFSTEYMGTGEGAQAFGWGLYFTDLEGIAKGYAKGQNKSIWQLKFNGQPFVDVVPLDGNSYWDRYWSNWMPQTYSKDDFIKAVEQQYLDGRIASPRSKRAKDFQNQKQRLIDAAKNGEITGWEDSRNLYKVSLHSGKSPEQYDYLRWDKELGKDKISKIFNYLGKEQEDSQENIDYMIENYMRFNDQTGEGVYRYLSNLLGSDKAASLFLLRAGIDGIKYPAEYTTKGSHEDAFNYVVFDENAVQIDEHIRFSIIGEQGAANLDRAEEATTRMDNLAVAREMEAANNPLDTLLNEYLENGSSLDNEDLMERYGLKRFVLQKKYGFAVLSLVETKTKGQGLGTKFMTDLVNWADKNGISIALTPSTSFGATSANRLKDFYKQFGFIENKGKVKDFSTTEAMIRTPKEVKKFTPQQIRLATGWERGADGKWRYEIPDGELMGVFAYINPQFPTTVLERSYINEELYEAYPELKSIKVDFSYKLGDKYGNYDNVNKTIKVSAENLKDRESILSHEIQHAIQDIEGFAKGGDTKFISATSIGEKKFKEIFPSLKAEFLKKEKEYTDKQRNYWANRKPGDQRTPEQIKKTQDEAEEIAKLRHMIHSYEKTGFIEEMGRYELYKRLSGEVEARNVQSRLNFTPEQRRETLLAETEDVAREDQIFLQQSLGTSLSLSEKSGMELPPTLTIDGVERPTTNSKGQFIAQTEEGVRNFYKWFGESKVVDEQGRPLVVYHGTRVRKNNGDQDFDIFKPSGDADLIFFSEDFNEANVFTSALGGNIIPAYLRVEKPYKNGERFNSAYEIEIAKKARRYKNDGFVVGDFAPYSGFWSAKNWVVFSPTQIKSATGNNGEFDGNNPDIRFRIAPTSTPTPAGLDPRMVTSKAEQLRELVQDKMLSVKNVQEATLSRGGIVPPAADIYNAENRSQSRSMAMIDNFNASELDDLNTSIAGIVDNHSSSVKEVNQYLKAKSSLQRNDTEGISALSEDAADYWNRARVEQIIADFEAKVPAATVYDLWDKVKAVTDFAIKKLYLGNVISKQAYDGMKARQYYVPLKSWQFDGDNPLDFYDYVDGDRTAYQGLKKADGRKSEADDPLAYMQAAAHSAVVQANKNMVKHKALMLARMNPDLTDLYTIKKVYLMEKGADPQGNPVVLNVIKDGEDAFSINGYDAAGNPILINEGNFQDLLDAGTITTKHSKTHTQRRPSYVAKQHEVVAYENGQMYIVAFGDPAVALAINNENTYSPPFTRGFQNFILGGRLTRWVSANFTAKNPAFIPINWIRDWGYATTSHAIRKDGNLALFMKNYRPAVAAIDRYLRGKAKPGTNAMDELYEKFREYGGETGFVHLREIESLKKDIEREINRKRGIRKGWDKISQNVVYRVLGKSLDYMALMSENTARFATFAASVEAGKTFEQAATDAKNISVNFNRKGRISGLAGSVYAFFNASIQGGHNLASMAKNNKKRFAFAATGFFVAGIMLSEMLRAFGPEDEEGENEYDKLPDWVRKSCLVLPSFGDGFITIPLPHGFRSIYGAGVALSDAMAGRTEAGAAIFDTVEDLWSAFSPIGIKAGELEKGRAPLRNIIPTAVVPIYDIIVNEDFTGREVYRVPFTKEGERYTPNSEQGSYNVNSVMQQLARAVNRLGGGDENTPAGFKIGEDGKIDYSGTKNFVFDWNPSKAEHMLEYYLGGRGRFFNDIYKTVQAAVSEEKDVQSYNIPVLKRLYMKPYEGNVWSDYYEIKQTIRDYDHFLKQSETGMDIATMKKLYGNVDMPALKAMFDVYDEVIQMHTDAGQVIQDPAKRKEVYDKRKEIMKQFVSQVRKMTKEE